MSAAVRRLHTAAAMPDVPCVTHREPLWLSDDQADRVKAARLCGDCPVIRECAAAARSVHPTFGVWAGVDYEPTETQDERVRRLSELREIVPDGSRGGSYRPERAERARIVVALRAEDPERWLLRELSAVAGLSMPSLTRVLRGEQSA